jgi:hypothetical protein
LKIFRTDHPREAFAANRQRLWQLIEEHGGSLDGRETSLRIVSEMITMNYSHLTISDAHAETMRILTED